MASKAIYSEIVELVLNIDKYNSKIAEANIGLSRLQAEAKDPINLIADNKAFIAGIDDAIAKERVLHSEFIRTNELIKERRRLAALSATRGTTGVSDFLAKQTAARNDITAQGMGGIAATNASNEQQIAKLRAQVAMDEAAKQKAAKDKEYADLKAHYKQLEALDAINASNEQQMAKLRAQKALEEAAAMKAAKDKEYADLKAHLRRMADMGASNALNAEQNQGALATARREQRARDRQANDEEARHQRRLMESEAKRRTDIDTIFDKQMRGRTLLDTAERNATSVEMQNRRALLADENKRLDTVRRRIAAEAEAAKKSHGYSLGATVLGGRTGAAFTGAASASFLLGANNLGAMFYMMERMSFATKIGGTQLGVFAEKLGLVKMTGEGAEASIAKFGSKLMSLGAVAGVVAAAIGTAFAGRKLDTALANMSTLLADTSVKGHEFANMIGDASVSAAVLSKAFGVDMVTVVNGFKTALSTGINADELRTFGMVALDLSKGLGSSFEEAISILTTFKDAFAGTVQDTVGYADVLFNAINVGKFNVQQLNANVGRVAVTAAEAGVSFKDMMAALATLNRVGMSTSQAITSLNQMIVSIVNPSDKAKKAFDSLGIAYGSAALKGKSLLAVVEEIKRKVGSNADLYGELFGEERGRRGAIGLAANPALFQANRVEMEKTGTAAEAAARAMDTFGQALYKTFLPTINAVQQLGEGILNVLNQLNKGRDTTFEWGNVFATFTLLVGGGLVALTGIVIGVIQGVQTMVMAFVDAGKVIDKALRLDFSGAWDAVQVMNSNIMQGVKDIGTTFVTAARGVGVAWEGVYSQINKNVLNSVTVAATTTTSVMDELKAAATTTAVSMTEDITKAYEAMVKKATTALEDLAAKQSELAAKAKENAFINDFNTTYWQHAKKPGPRSAGDEETAMRNEIARADSIIATTDDEAHKRALQEWKVNAEAFVKEKKRIRDELYAKEMKELDEERKRRLDEALKAAGFDVAPIVRGKGATVTSPEVDARIQSDASDMMGMLVKLEQLQKGAKKGSDDAVAAYDETLAELREKYDSFLDYIMANQGSMSSATAKAAGLQASAIGGALEDATATGKSASFRNEFEAKLKAIEATIANKDKVAVTDTFTGYAFGGTDRGSGTGTYTTTSMKQLTGEEAVAKAKQELADLRNAYEQHKNELSEIDKAYAEEKIASSEGKLKKAEEDAHKAKMKSYKEQYDQELKLYNLKMNLIEKEQKRFDDAKRARQEEAKKVEDTLRDLYAKERPGAARRQLKDEAEDTIKKASNAKSQEEATALLRMARELLDKMVSTGDAPERAARDQRTMLEEIKRIGREGGRKFDAQSKESIDRKTRNAKSSLDNAVLENPIAQEAIKQATRIVQEMAATAAKHGITMNGELVATTTVNVDANIPIGALRDAVVDTVKTEFTRLANDMIKKKEYGNNLNPKGVDYDSDSNVVPMPTYNGAPSL